MTCQNLYCKHPDHYEERGNGRGRFCPVCRKHGNCVVRCKYCGDGVNVGDRFLRNSCHNCASSTVKSARYRLIHMVKEKICPNCGGVFEYPGKRIYCSNLCRHEAVLSRNCRGKRRYMLRKKQRLIIKEALLIPVV